MLRTVCVKVCACFKLQETPAGQRARTVDANLLLFRAIAAPESCRKTNNELGISPFLRVLSGENSLAR